MERFILLPLDITTPHELPFPYYKAKVDPTFHSTTIPSQRTAKSPLTHFTSAFLERTREVMLQFGKDVMELHDIVAVWCAIENPSVLVQDKDSLPTLTSGWKAVMRKFEIERYAYAKVYSVILMLPVTPRTGEITRGMLVVDRRDDGSAYAPGANRAEVQAQLEKNDMHGNIESVPLPAQTGIECPSGSWAGRAGVACITETPGSRTLVDMLLKRVWGIIEE